MNKVMIIPGNGNTDISFNWYLYVKKELEKLGFEVIAENMPDADLARKEFWLPFMEKKLAGDEKAILIGHSSGAIAILKYLETHKAEGAVIVGAYYTDLGESNEKASGYFDDEWQWGKIRQNTKWILQFASVDDPFIPIEEPRLVAKRTNSEYHEYTDQGHFGSGHEEKSTFPELVEAIKKHIKK